MSLQHKAFAFDHARFVAELRGVLEAALASGQVDGLRRFIETHRGELRHPDQGGVLEAAWESRLEARDVQEYGDLALTRYYDPDDDVGLAYDWEQIIALLGGQGSGDTIVLGTPLRAGEVMFDPGRLGSYFRSATDIDEQLAAVRARITAESLAAQPLATLVELLEAGQGRGLYVTF